MGSFLRHAQQRGAARDALEQALAIFEELGGRLWADKARAELARDQRSPTAIGAYSPRQNDRSLDFAGQGQSNKEIAASLHMGVSTVEAHLSERLPQADVRRAGLASALAEVQT